MSPRRLLAVGACIVAFTIAAACSTGNREGPDVTCEDLACGRVNACKDGIIAQCVDGLVVRFQVCADEAVCEKDWQVPNEYTCSQEDSDCEGCRPERIEGCNWLDPRGGSGGDGGSNEGGAGGGGSSDGGGGTGGGGSSDGGSSEGGGGTGGGS